MNYRRKCRKVCRERIKRLIAECLSLNPNATDKELVEFIRSEQWVIDEGPTFTRIWHSELELCLLERHGAYRITRRYALGKWETLFVYEASLEPLRRKVKE